MNSDFSVYAMAGDEDGGCGFYRIREPARVALDSGLDIGVHTSIPADVELRKDNAIIHGLEVSPDVLIIQRPLLESFFKVIQYAQSRGIACVVEIDDDLVATHPDNVAYFGLNPKFSKTSNWDWLVKSCAIADMVTVSSDELARRYAPHGRSRVLRNLVPASSLKGARDPSEALRLGWSGTVQTHPHDLDVAGPHIGAALLNSATDQNFYVVGDPTSVKEKLFLHGEVKATGWVPRTDYIETMNDHFDIGVVPLTLDQFNQSKSWLKGLEMASQGIPSVLSPTNENVLLSGITGNPVAIKPKDWQKHLKKLFDLDYYLERSYEVSTAVTPYTYENHVEDWIQAWSDAIDNRRKSS